MNVIPSEHLSLLHSYFASDKITVLLQILGRTVPSPPYSLHSWFQGVYKLVIAGMFVLLDQSQNSSKGLNYVVHCKSAVLYEFPL